jgi:TIP41-like family
MCIHLMQVPVAVQWQAARLAEIQAQAAAVLRYDWTFSSSYSGSISWGPPQGWQVQQQQQVKVQEQVQEKQQQQSESVPCASTATAEPHSGTGGAAAAAALAQGLSMQQQPTLQHEQQQHEKQQQKPMLQDEQQQQQPKQQVPTLLLAGHTALLHPLPAWQPSERQIDRRMLMARDEPILFYADVPLYESELDDNGVCQLSVKV